ASEAAAAAAQTTEAAATQAAAAQAADTQDAAAQTAADGALVRVSPVGVSDDDADQILKLDRLEPAGLLGRKDDRGTAARGAAKAAATEAATATAKATPRQDATPAPPA